MAIHQEVLFDATPAQLFEALTTGGAFAEVTGAPAEISAQEGGAFSCFGGQIVGRVIEIVPDERVVQAWRVAGWPPGVFSIVTMNLEASAGKDGGQTRLTLDQAGHPDAAEKDLDAGWPKMYWDPLKIYLSA